MARAPSIFEQAMRLSWLNGINDVTASPAHDIRTWLMQGTYSVQRAPATKAFEIFIPDPSGLLEAYAFDANRMSCSAFETILSIAPILTMRRSLAWLAIKLYYAAFYSAHAFLRLQGVSCTQLQNRETSRLAAVAQAYGYGADTKIASGFYAIAFDPNGKRLSFVNTGIDGGGSHEVLWLEFDRRLETLQTKIDASTFLSSDKASLISHIDAARILLHKEGCRNANWLSKVRNEITYRHSLGVWFPHRADNNIDHFTSLIRHYLLADPLENELEDQDKLDSFIKTCLFVVNITRATIADMSTLRADGESFQNAGPTVVLRRARLLR